MSTIFDPTAATWARVYAHTYRSGHTFVIEQSTATYVGRGEFFSGVRTGAEVIVKRARTITPEGASLGEEYSVNVGGAGLAVRLADLRA